MKLFEIDSGNGVLPNRYLAIAGTNCRLNCKFIINDLNEKIPMIMSKDYKCKIPIKCWTLCGGLNELKVTCWHYSLRLFTKHEWLAQSHFAPLLTCCTQKMSMLCNSSWLYLGQISPTGLQSSNSCHVYLCWICNKHFLNLQFWILKPLIEAAP